MKINPYLTFNGTCREAFEFYQKTLDGEIIAMMPFSEMPTDVAETAADSEGCAGGVTEDMKDHIMHACLQVGDIMLMASDAPDGEFKPSQGIHVALGVDTVEEAERIYAGLSEGGTVVMPLEETFWAKRFAMFTDKYGTPWMINCDKPMP